MAIDLIDVGSAENDGTGTPDRTAWMKVNAMFTEVYARAPAGLSGLLAADAGTGNYRVAVIGDISFAGVANGLATLDSGATVPMAQLKAGVANGLATLGSDGTLASGQIPAALLGAVNYQGGWDASANSPALTSGTGTKGFYYIVTTAGTTNLDGITNWAIGDWAVYDGTKWDQVKNADAVISVAGLVGIITATSLKSALSISYGDVSGLGTAAQYNVGTAAGNIVRLDATTGKLPAVDGSLLTGIGTSGRVLLATLTASNSASLADTTHLTSAYDRYEIVLDHLVPVTDGDYFVLQVTQDGGSTWLATGYLAGMSCQLVGTTSQNSTQRFALATGIPLAAPSASGYSVGSAAGKGLSGSLYVDRPSVASLSKMFYGDVYYAYTDGKPVVGQVAGYYSTDQNAINGFRIIGAASNISAGIARLYGIKTS